MQDHHSITATGETSRLPPDDPQRILAVLDPNSSDATKISVVGDVYTILIRGSDTEGRYCLIDMRIPDGGGPPPHRHDFEEMFTLVEGELEFTFRGETRTVSAPASVNIPANAPHQFRNRSGRIIHMLCMCTPAGQEEFFEAVAIPVPAGTGDDFKPSEEEMADQGKRMEALAATYRTEFL